MRLPPVEEILPHLDGVRRSGKGYVARCPAHDDQKQSLSVADGDEGTLAYCFSGCTFDAISTAILGLLGHDPGGRDVSHDAARDVVAGGDDVASIGGASVAALEPSGDVAQGGRGQIVAAYTYAGPDGAPLYQQVRYEPKGFSRRYPDGSGGWSDVRPADPPAGSLYRLPELLGSIPDRPVWVVEGEKDADRLASLGLVATTSGGATSWRPEFGEYLTGRKVIVVPDNDPPGRKYAAAVSASVRGKAVSTRIVRLPAVPVHGDVSDWLDAGHSLQDLLGLALRTREYPPRRWSPVDLTEAQLPTLEGFLNGAIFCRQTVGMIAGRRGYGKTFLLLRLMHAIATGAPFGPFPVRPGKVLFMSQEMTDVEIKDRLGAMFSAAELRAMGNVTIICRDNVRIDTDEAVDAFAATVEAVGPDVVMIDTLSHVKGSIRENDNDEMGAGARRLIDGIATPYNCAVIVTHHSGRAKEDGSTNPRGASSWEDMLADIMFLEHPKGAAFKIGTFAEPNGKVRHAATPEKIIYTISTDMDRVEVDVMKDSGLIADRDTLIARVIGLVERRGALTANEIAEALGVSRAIARDTVQGAKTIGLIERFGTGSDARWGLRVSGPSSEE